LTRFAQLEQAAAALHGGTLSPALIVVVQDWPGQVSASEIDRLRCAAPLARICGMLGSWCEGETRSGKPWPGAVRCYWHQWPARFQQEIAALAAGESSVWSLPPTASAEEQLLAAVPLRPPQQHGLLAIIADNAETAATLSDAAQARGYETAALRSPRGAQISGAVATLWDARPEIIANPELVSQVRRVVAGTPLIALTSFPRAEHVASAKAAGVAAIVSKPFLLKDLFWQVEQLAFPDRQAKRD
jgi:CheY-like chemotaxis protein